MASTLGFPLSLVAVLLLHSLLAAILAWRMALPWWWVPIEFLFVPAVAAALFLPIAPAWFLVGFALLAVVYWSSYRSRVPLYLSGPRVWRALEALLPAEPGAIVLDLGSGLGGPLRYLVRRRPELQYEGIEAAPLPFALSWLRARGSAQLRFRFGSFWERDLSDCRFVFAYLSPAAMPRLWEKVQREMRPGSVFVSIEFEVPGVAPHEAVEAGARQRLYVWRF
jgi:SAM-dependent methyltransferase